MYLGIIPEVLFWVWVGESRTRLARAGHWFGFGQWPKFLTIQKILIWWSESAHQPLQVAVQCVLQYWSKIKYERLNWRNWLLFQGITFKTLLTTERLYWTVRWKEEILRKLGLVNKLPEEVFISSWCFKFYCCGVHCVLSTAVTPSWLQCVMHQYQRTDKKITHDTYHFLLNLSSCL